MDIYPILDLVREQHGDFFKEISKTEIRLSERLNRAEKSAEDMNSLQFKMFIFFLVLTWFIIFGLSRFASTDLHAAETRIERLETQVQHLRQEYMKAVKSQ